MKIEEESDPCRATSKSDYELKFPEKVKIFVFVGYYEFLSREASC